MRLLHVRARKAAVTVRDALFLIGWGLCMAAAAHVYALTDWAAPLLIDKTRD